jgi:hypothetical protein
MPIFNKSFVEITLKGALSQKRTLLIRIENLFCLLSHTVKCRSPIQGTIYVLPTKDDIDMSDFLKLNKYRLEQITDCSAPESIIKIFLSTLLIILS